MLLSRSGHRFLSRRLLSDWSGRRWATYGLRESHRGISRFLRARRKRSGHAPPGMGVPRAEAGRQVVRLRHALEKRPRTRWKSALDHNRAAPVDLEATHASALEFVTLEELKAYALK